MRLAVWSEAENIDQLDWAMQSLKDSMTWDEQVSPTPNPNPTPYPIPLPLPLTLPLPLPLPLPYPYPYP